MRDQDRGWERPPDGLTLHPDELHVWRIQLDDDLAGGADLCLSADERQRAARFAFPHLARRYVAGRAALRAILGRYLGLDPAGIRFAYGPRRKPRLADTAAAEVLAFNVSHSDDLALCAIARRRVGIDVERVRLDQDRFASPERFFSAVECATLRALGADDRRRAGYRCWTRKEALLKACGEGLAVPLDSFDVSCAPGDPPRILEVRAPALQGRCWALWDVEVTDGWAAAVASEATPSRLRRWRWAWPARLAEREPG